MSLMMNLADASKALNKSTSTLRGAINSGELQSEKRKGTHFINLNDATQLFASRSRSSNVTRAGATADANQDPTAVWQARIDDLTRALERERTLVDHLNKQVEKLHEAQTQHLAEMRALMENSTKDKSPSFPMVSELKYFQFSFPSL
jgi:hypothetical protein